jgi:hypothetical protein
MGNVAGLLVIAMKTAVVQWTEATLVLEIQLLGHLLGVLGHWCHQISEQHSLLLLLLRMMESLLAPTESSLHHLVEGKQSCEK